MEVDDPPEEGGGPPGAIDAGRMRRSLTSLALFGYDYYLGIQATNLDIVDAFITDLEADVARKRFDEDLGHLPLAALLSAQTQMWIFAVYELLRTWRQRARKVIELKKSGKLDAEIAELEAEIGFEHVARKMRARQLRKVRGDEDLVRRVQDDLKRTHIPFATIDHLRVAMAKHEVKGRGSPAYSPGSGYPDVETGSLRYEIETDGDTFGLISRREIADGLRGLGELPVPADEEIDGFKRMMKGPAPRRTKKPKDGP